MDSKMKQLLRLLFVSLLSRLWRSMEAAQNQNSVASLLSPPLCYDSHTGKSCFTTFRDSTNHAVRMSFEGASDWCKRHVPGSSLIVINSTDSQRAVEDFLGRHVFSNETIIMDARKLSNGNSVNWSWVNGHQTIPENIRGESVMDGACVTSKDGQSLVYCKGLVETSYRYICETSDANSTSEFSYRQNNKTYIASVTIASWYDAREECIRFGGDLASITDLQSISRWSRLKENEDCPYWIGLHRNRWIWNSTGASLTYTNWDRDSQDQSSDSHCICINPGCMRNRQGNTNCDDNRKWRICNCDQNYTIVCQKDETSDVLTTENVVTKERLQTTRMPTIRKNSNTRSASKRNNSSRMTSATKPFTATTSTKTTSATTPSIITTSTNTTSATIPPTIATSTNITRATTPSTITTSTKTTSATIPPTIATSTKITRATTPSTITTSTKTTKAATPSTITTSTKTTRATTPSTITTSTKTISAPIVTQKSSKHFSENQTTASETSSTGLSISFNSTAIIILVVVLVLVAIGFIIAAIILVIRKRRYDRPNDGSSTKNTTQSDTAAPVYATVAPGNRPPDATAPAASPIYADIEITQQPMPSNNTIYASVQPSNVIYSELNKPLKSPTQKDEAVKGQGPIYQDAIEAMPGARSGGIATQEPNAVYAEPLKLKKTSDGRSDGSTMKNATQNETVSSVYATVVPDNRPSEDTAPTANPIYADIEMTHQPTTSSNTIYASVQPTNVIYSEINKPLKSPTQKGESVKEQGFIYQDAIQVKPGVESGGAATQDPSAIYAEPMKMKKTS